MKTYNRILTLAVLPALLLTGCSKGLEKGQENNGTRDGGTRSDMEVLSGNALKGVAGQETKTYLTADDRIAWSDGDKVWLLGATNDEFEIVPLGTDATHGFLQGGVLPEPFNGSVAYTALYPSDMFKTTVTKPSDISGTLPKEYDYAEYALNPLKCFPMIARSSSKVLDFQSVCGLLEINLTGEMTVDSVEVSTTSATAHLAGDFKIKLDNTLDFTGEDDRITIDCGEGVKLNAARPVRFCVPLVPGDYGDVKVKVYTQEMTSTGGSCEKVVPELKVEKGMIYASTFKADRDAVQLWPGGPWFATCNVGAFQPADYGSKYAWSSTEKIYSNPDVQSGTSGSFAFKTSPVDYSNGFSWKSYVFFDPWDGNTTYVGDATATSSFSKYNLAGSVLSESDDIARKLWEGSWRMLTAADEEALFENCYAEWVTDYENSDNSQVNGYIIYKVKSTSHRNVVKINDGTFKSMIPSAAIAGPSPAPSYDRTKDPNIFLPAAGYGDSGEYKGLGGYGNYWTVTLGTSSRAAYRINFGPTQISESGANRYQGFSIRPVHD